MVTSCPHARGAVDGLPSTLARVDGALASLAAHETSTWDGSAVLTLAERSATTARLQVVGRVEAFVLAEACARDWARVEATRALGLVRVGSDDGDLRSLGLGSTGGSDTLAVRVHGADGAADASCDFILAHGAANRLARSGSLFATQTLTVLASPGRDERVTRRAKCLTRVGRRNVGLLTRALVDTLLTVVDLAWSARALAVGDGGHVIPAASRNRRNPSLSGSARSDASRAVVFHSVRASALTVGDHLIVAAALGNVWLPLLSRSAHRDTGAAIVLHTDGALALTVDDVGHVVAATFVARRLPRLSARALGLTLSVDDGL